LPGSPPEASARCGHHPVGTKPVRFRRAPQFLGWRAPVEPGEGVGLTSALAAEFDSEWDIVLERAKQSKDLAGVHDLLNKWRHTAYMEMRDPGSHHQMLTPRPSRSCAPAATRTWRRSRTRRH